MSAAKCPDCHRAICICAPPRAAEPSPGPWIAEPVDGRDGFVYCRIRPLRKSADHAIASVGPKEINVFTGAEAMANGGLIAAAPDLLAACEGLLRLVDHLGDVVPWGSTFNLDAALLNEAPIAARRAVEKARRTT